MKYFDRKGCSISLSKWKELYWDPEYVNILWTETDDKIVRTCWVGLQHESEDLPLTFVVMIRKLKKDKDERMAVWFTCEANALIFHNELMRKPTLVVKGNPYKNVILEQRGAVTSK